MSYSISIPAGPAEDFGAAVVAALDAYDFAATNADGEEPARAAGEVLTQFVEGGHIAPSDGFVQATISGHGNPNHSNEGTNYTRDHCSFSVSQAAAPAG